MSGRPKAIPTDRQEWFDEMDDIMDVAVKKAIEENRRLGIEMPAPPKDPPAKAESAPVEKSD